MHLFEISGSTSNSFHQITNYYTQSVVFATISSGIYVAAAFYSDDGHEVLFKEYDLLDHPYPVTVIVTAFMFVLSAKVNFCYNRVSEIELMTISVCRYYSFSLWGLIRNVVFQMHDFSFGKHAQHCTICTLNGWMWV